MAIYFCLSCLSSLFHLRIEYNLSNHVCSQSFAVYVCMKIKWSQLRMVRLPILTTARCQHCYWGRISHTFMDFCLCSPSKYPFRQVQMFIVLITLLVFLFVLFFGSEFCFIWFSCGVSCLSYLFHLRNWI